MPDIKPTLYVVDKQTEPLTRTVQYVETLLLDCPQPPSGSFKQSRADLNAARARQAIAAGLLQSSVIDGAHIRALTPIDWHHIRQQGDNYFWELLAAKPRDERQRERSREWDDICCWRGRRTYTATCHGDSLDCPVRDAERERERSREWSRGGYGR